MKFYIPEDIAEDYKYLVPGADYYDLYNTNYLEPNSTYRFYRFYTSVDQSIYLSQDRVTSNYNYGSLNCVEIEPDHSYIYRKDYPQIVSTVFILTLGFVVLINIFTSIIRKGGLLSGLF